MRGEGIPPDTEPPSERRGTAVSRSRQTVDRGRALDKVPGFDPAAAPLDTDAESAGTPSPSPAAPPAPRHTGPPPGQSADPAGADRATYRAQDRLVWPAIGAAFLVAAGTAIAVGFLA